MVITLNRGLITINLFFIAILLAAFVQAFHVDLLFLFKYCEADQFEQWVHVFLSSTVVIWVHPITFDNLNRDRPPVISTTKAVYQFHLGLKTCLFVDAKSIFYQSFHFVSTLVYNCLKIINWAWLDLSKELLSFSIYNGLYFDLRCEKPLEFLQIKYKLSWFLLHLRQFFFEHAEFPQLIILTLINDLANQSNFNWWKKGRVFTQV